MSSTTTETIQTQRKITTFTGHDNTVDNKQEYKWDIVWHNGIGLIYVHIASIYGLYLVCVYGSGFTIIYGLLYGVFSAIGVSAGAHRLWSHRSYKANTALRLLLMFMFTSIFQENMFQWVRNHRVHHKFTETDADPHNPTRGFFFSHFGWLLVRKHKDVVEKGKTVDMSDLEADPIVMFQKKYYFILMPILAFIVPPLIPYYFWDEDIWVCYYYLDIFRFTLTMNATLAINSFAHKFGYKPYDKSIAPTDNPTIGYFTMGEGSHNYHHVFPWDYRSSEFVNFTMATGFIDLMARIGWATELKTANKDIIKSRAARTGDGSVCENNRDRFVIVAVLVSTLVFIFSRKLKNKYEMFDE